MNCMLMIVATVGLAGLGAYFTARTVLGVVAWILMIQPWGLLICGEIAILPAFAIDVVGVALFLFARRRIRGARRTDGDDRGVASGHA